MENKPAHSDSKAQGENSPLEYSTSAVESRITPCEWLVFLLSCVLVAMVILIALWYNSRHGGASGHGFPPPAAPGDMWYNGGTRDMI